jgi:hypothetical protein
MQHCGQAQSLAGCAVRRMHDTRNPQATVKSRQPIIELQREPHYMRGMFEIRIQHRCPAPQALQGSCLDLLALRQFGSPRFPKSSFAGRFRGN